MSKALALISKREEDLAFGQAVAATAGLEFIPLGDPKEIAVHLAADRVSVVLVDTSDLAHYKRLEDSIQQSIGLFSDRINANAFHFISSENIEKVQYLIESPLFGNFVIRNYGNPTQAGEHYGRLVKTTQMPRAFGLSNLMKPGAKIQVVKLKSTLQKQGAVDAVKNFLTAAKFNSRMATQVANAVDELLMNAMFDAPVDELGKTLFEGTSRATEMALEGKHAVEMHVGYDGEYAAVSAIDLFGSLDKVKLLKHISKIYTDEEYKVRSSYAGAGLGLSTVFRSGGSLFFVSESSGRTEVTVTYRRFDSFREFKDQFRFLATQFYF